MDRERVPILCQLICKITNKDIGAYYSYLSVTIFEMLLLAPWKVSHLSADIITFEPQNRVLTIPVDIESEDCDILYSGYTKNTKLETDQIVTSHMPF